MTIVPSDRGTMPMSDLLPDGTHAAELDREALFRKLAKLEIPGIAPDQGKQLLLDALGAYIQTITRVVWPPQPGQSS